MYLFNLGCTLGVFLYFHYFDHTLSHPIFPSLSSFPPPLPTPPQLLGATHPDVAKQFTNLAILCQHLGKYDEVRVYVYHVTVI